MAARFNGSVTVARSHAVPHLSLNVAVVRRCLRRFAKTERPDVIRLSLVRSSTMRWRSSRSACCSCCSKSSPAQPIPPTTIKNSGADPTRSGPLTRSFVAHCGTCHYRRCMAQRGPHPIVVGTVRRVAIATNDLACPGPDRVQPHARKLAWGGAVPHIGANAMQCNAMRGCVAAEPSLGLCVVWLSL